VEVGVEDKKPSKNKIFVWLSLANEILTSDNGQKQIEMVLVGAYFVWMIVKLLTISLCALPILKSCLEGSFVDFKRE
jgi:hypothetical protein